MNNQFRKFRLCQTWNPSNRLLFFFIFCYFQSMASYSISLNLTNLIVIWSQNINWLGKKRQTSMTRAHTHKDRKRERWRKTDLQNNHLIHSMALFQKWLKIDVTPTFFISMKFQKSVSESKHITEEKNCLQNPHMNTIRQWTIFICQLHLFGVKPKIH